MDQRDERDDDKAVITRFLAGTFRHHELDDDEDIFETGYVNSMFVMQLVLMVEEELGVVVADEDLEFDNFRSVNAIAAFVARKRSALASA